MYSKIKKLFYSWAYLDLEHTCSKKDTYFWRFSQEIALKNLSMMRSISLFFLIICTFVIVSTYLYFDSPLLRYIYLLIFAFEFMICIVCTILMKHPVSRRIVNAITSLYLIHMLAISGYIGVVYSPFESATVFVAVLVIAAMLFTLTPLLSTTIVTLSTIATLIASYYIKDPYWFQSDVINCIGVWILSLLLGWKVNKIRLEEAFARHHALDLNETLRYLSITDQLTGLGNHWSFQDTYYQMFENAQNHNTRLGIIMIDLDNFKSYNDNYGHVAGDHCLHTVSSAFSKQMKEGIRVYRYGGEEFIILLEDNVCDQAIEVGNAFRQAVETLAIPHEFSNAAPIVTISVGLYVGIPTSEDKPMQFVDHADKAMYNSKRNGRNCLTTQI